MFQKNCSYPKYDLQIILSFYEFLKLKNSIQNKINNSLKGLSFAKRKELTSELRKLY